VRVLALALESFIEFFDGASGGRAFLLTGVKRVTHIADVDSSVANGGRGFDYVATSTAYGGTYILGMDIRFHSFLNAFGRPSQYLESATVLLSFDGSVK
jgi:hypothetical protein